MQGLPRLDGTSKKIRIAVAFTYGEICKGRCEKCKDKPTAQLPVGVPCPSCEGKGCPSCDGDGEYKLTECPANYCSEILGLLPFADRYHQGIPLIEGGQLAHPQWFLDACSRIWAEQNAWKAHYMTPKGK